ALLKTSKNIILQGPPGVGKTFVAQRIAYALMREKAKERVRMVQFHQSYSYEDFVQGFRPTNDGKFRRKDGVFYRFSEKARKDEERPYVFIIDEINRGNLSKIFGELMMLVEADKRGPDWGMPLQYGTPEDPPFHVPENVHLIGMMNTADRSLAVVDYALRRRFRFVDISPALQSRRFAAYLAGRHVPTQVIELIQTRIGRLNRTIAQDIRQLGPGFCIGHSFFCPALDEPDLSEAWYRRVIEYEIGPLLKEYYFDDPERAEQEIINLLG
ncbi:MAG: AAA family ATPase, partial [Bradymonadaceae bacterium]